MRRLALSAASLLVATSVAHAEPGQGYHQAGWYIAKNVPIKQAITIFGQYDTRDQCDTVRTTPPPADNPKLDFRDHGSVTFECIYLDREPMR